MVWAQQTRGRGWFAATLGGIPAWRVPSGPLIPQVPIASGERSAGGTARKNTTEQKRGLKGWEMENGSPFFAVVGVLGEFFVWLVFYKPHKHGVFSRLPKTDQSGDHSAGAAAASKVSQNLQPPRADSAAPGAGAVPGVPAGPSCPGSICHTRG